MHLGYFFTLNDVEVSETIAQKLLWKLYFPCWAYVEVNVNAEAETVERNDLCAYFDFRIKRNSSYQVHSVKDKEEKRLKQMWWFAIESDSWYLMKWWRQRGKRTWKESKETSCNAFSFHFAATVFNFNEFTMPVKHSSGDVRI